MTFVYSRTVRFQETDAAGVVYFANGLALCHEAYEASLAAAGIDVKTFFSPVIPALPIVHATIDFYRPLYCGDRLLIHLIPTPLTEFSFEITYQLYREASEHVLSKALTRHVCINPETRQKLALPEQVQAWLEGLWGKELSGF